MAGSTLPAYTDRMTSPTMPPEDTAPSPVAARRAVRGLALAGVVCGLALIAMAIDLWVSSRTPTEDGGTPITLFPVADDHDGADVG